MKTRRTDRHLCRRHRGGGATVTACSPDSCIPRIASADAMREAKTGADIRNMHDEEMGWIGIKRVAAEADGGESD